MSDMSDQPLSQLALSLMDADTRSELTGRAPESLAVHDHAHHAHGTACSNSYGWWSLLFMFLLFAIVLYFVFFALKPQFVLKSHCGSRSSSDSNEYSREIDQNKLLGYSVLGAIVLLVILWLIWLAYSW